MGAVGVHRRLSVRRGTCRKAQGLSARRRFSWWLSRKVGSSGAVVNVWTRPKVMTCQIAGWDW
jgi:hypothetical protein